MTSVPPVWACAAGSTNTHVNAALRAMPSHHGERLGRIVGPILCCEAARRQARCCLTGTGRRGQHSSESEPGGFMEAKMALKVEPMNRPVRAAARPGAGAPACEAVP